MPAAALSQRTSRAVTVRLDPVIRVRLEELATASDRSLSQLIRYALAYFFATPGLLIEADLADTSGPGHHTTLRLPDQLWSSVEAAAEAAAVSTSDVIRSALRSWLASGEHETLGFPAGSATGEVRL